MSWFIRLRDSWITLCQDTPKTRLGNQCEFVGYNCRTQVFQVDYVFLFQRMFFFFVGWVSNWNSSCCFPKLWLSSSRLSIGDPDHALRKGGGGCNLHGQVTFQKHEVFTRGVWVLSPFGWKLSFLRDFCIFFWGEILSSPSFQSLVFVCFFFFAKALLKSSGTFLGSFLLGPFFSTTRTPKSCFFFVQFLALEELVDLRNGRQKTRKSGSYRIGESSWILTYPPGN